MKVLLDENLPHRLRHALRSHEVFTVRYQGWSGLKNGELLKTAEAGGFEVFVTGDKTIPYEQNLGGRQIALVVLSAIEWHIVQPNLPTIQAAIDAATAGSHHTVHHTVEVGTFNRKLPRGR